MALRSPILTATEPSINAKRCADGYFRLCVGDKDELAERPKYIFTSTVKDRFMT